MGNIFDENKNGQNVGSSLNNGKPSMPNGQSSSGNFSRPNANMPNARPVSNGQQNANRQFVRPQSASPNGSVNGSGFNSRPTNVNGPQGVRPNAPIGVQGGMQRPNGQPSPQWNGQGRPMPNGMPPRQNVQGGPRPNMQGAPQKNGTNKTPGKKKKKIAFIAIACSVVLAIAGVILGIFAGNKSYTVSFVTGPFEACSSLTVASGFTANTPDVEDLRNEDGELLVEFEGWYLDKNYETEYIAQPILKDTVLYAKYNCKEITSTFYISDLYSGDSSSYVYVADIKTKYYEETLDLSSFDVIEKIINFDAEIYDDQNYTVRSFDVKEAKAGNAVAGATSKSEYTKFLRDYYYNKSLNIISVTSSDGNVYKPNDKIQTPTKHTYYKLDLQANSVNIYLNPNYESVVCYYETLGKDFDYEKDAEGKSSSIQDYAIYNSEYTFKNYETAFSGNSKYRDAKKYHEFIGWTTKENLNEDGTLKGNKSALVSSGKIYTENTIEKIDRKFLQSGKTIVLYAVWEVRKGSIIIYTSLSQDSAYKAEEMSVGSNVTLQEDYSSIVNELKNQKPGYSLVGFNTKADLTGKVIGFDTPIVCDETNEYYDKDRKQIVLYAVYKKNINSIKIYLGDNEKNPAKMMIGGIESNILEQNAETIKSLLSINMGLKDGYEYNAPEVSINKTERSIAITNLLEGATFVLPTITRENYAFESYVIKNEDYPTGLYTTNENDLDESGNLIIDCFWAGDSVTFNVYDGYSSTPKTFQVVPYGSRVKLETTIQNDNTTTNAGYVKIEMTDLSTNRSYGSIYFERVGYNFVGWIKNDVEFPTGYPNDFVVEDFTSIKAEWTEKEYTLTFKLQGGSYDLTSGDGRARTTDPVNVENVKYGSSASLISPTYTGYHLLGWATTDDIDATIKYSYTETEVAITNNLTLYAVYEKAYAITIYEDINKTSSTTIYAGRTIDGNKYVLDNISFNGIVSRFNTSPTGDGVEYNASSEEKTTTEDIELYAMWYEVGFASAGEGKTSLPSFWVTKDVVLTLPQANYSLNKNNGYSFGGFSYNGTDYTGYVCVETQKFDCWTANTTKYSDGYCKITENVEFIPNYVDKDIRVDLYLTDTNSIVASKKVEDNKITISTTNKNYPTRVGYELDYIKDASTSEKYAYFVNTIDAPIEINIPTISTEYMSQDEYQFVYKLVCVWKKRIIINANNETTQTVTMHVGATRDENTLTGDYAKVTVTNEFDFEYTSSALGTAGSHNIEFAHKNFVGYDLTETISTETPKYDAKSVLSLTDITEDTTLYVIWEDAKYTLKVSTADGSETSVNYTYGQIVDLGENLTRMSLSKQDSSTGIYSDMVGLKYNNGTKDVIFDLDEQINMLSKDDGGDFNETDIVSGITLEGVWEERKYDIYLFLNGGSVDSVLELPANASFVQFAKDDTTLSAIKYSISYTDLNKNGITLHTGVSRTGFVFYAFVENYKDDTTLSQYVYLTGSNGEYSYKLCSKESSDVIANFLELKNKDYEKGISFSWTERFTIKIDENDGIASSIPESESINVQNVDGVEFVEYTIPTVEMQMDDAVFVGFYFTNDVEKIEQYLSEGNSLFVSGNTVKVTRAIMEEYGKSNTITLYAIYKKLVTFTYNIPDLSDTNVTVTGEVVPSGVEKVEIGTADDGTFGVYYFVGKTLTASELSEYSIDLSVDYYELVAWLQKISSSEIRAFESLVISSDLKNITLVTNYELTTFKIYFKTYDGKDIGGGIYFELGKGVASVNVQEEFNNIEGVKDISVYGYNFKGWSLYPGATPSTNKNVTLYNNETNLPNPNQSISLYATYTPKQVKVTYNTTNGEGEKVTDNALFDESYRIISVQYTRNYHNLVGWTLLNGTDNSTVYKTNDTIEITTQNGVTQGTGGAFSIALEPVWERQTKTIEIAFDASVTFNESTFKTNYATALGESGILKSYSYNQSTGLFTMNVLIGQGNKINMPSANCFSRAGYVVNSYKSSTTASKGTGEAFSVSTTTTVRFTPVWTAVTYLKIYKDTNDTDPIIIEGLLYGDEIKFGLVDGKPTINSNEITKTRENYTISGYTTSNGIFTYSIDEVNTIKLTNENFEVTEPTGSEINKVVNLYCVWLGDETTLTLRDNDSKETVQEDKLISTRFGQTVDLTPYLTYFEGEEGYHFDYFKFGETKYNAENVAFYVDENQLTEDGYVLIAQYIANSYTVTYDFGTTTINYDGQEVSSFTETYSYGSKISIYNPEDILNKFDKDRQQEGVTLNPVYEFDGYTTSDLGDTTKVDTTSNNILMPANNVKLTVNWKSKLFRLNIDIKSSYLSDASAPTGESSPSVTNNEITKFNTNNNVYKATTGDNLIQITGLRLGDSISLSTLPSASSMGYNFSYYFLENYVDTSSKVSKDTAKVYSKTSNFDVSVIDNTNSPLSNLNAMWNGTSNCFDLYFSLVWSPITYTVEYSNERPERASGVISGSFESQTFTYDLESTLAVNDTTGYGYVLTGWKHTGWTTVSPTDTETKRIEGTNLFSFLGTTTETVDGQTGNVPDTTNIKKIFNFTKTDGATVVLYPVWENITYTVEFKDEKNSDSKFNKKVSGVGYDLNFVPSALISDITVGEKCFSEYYYKFVGWEYRYTENGENKTIQIGHNEEKLFSVEKSKNGFISTNDINNSNTIYLYAVWEEVSYTLQLNLGKGVYSSGNNIFGTTYYNEITGERTIYYTIKYSELVVGVYLNKENNGFKMGFNPQLLSLNDFTMAGIKDSQNKLVSLVQTSASDNSQDIILKYTLSDPKTTLSSSNYVFEFTIVYNDTKVVLDGNGGTLNNEENVAIVDSITIDKTEYTYNSCWKKLDDKSLVLYTFVGANVAINNTLREKFSKEGYHLADSSKATEAGKFDVVGETTKQITWEGDFRYIILDLADASMSMTSPDGATGYESDTFTYVPVDVSDQTTYNSELGENKKLYYYDKAVAGYFVASSSYTSGTKYYKQVEYKTNYHIEAKNGDRIDSIKDLVVEGDKTFCGFVDEFSNNVTTRGLVIDNSYGEVIYLKASYNASVYFELNGGTFSGTYNGKEYSSSTTIKEVELDENNSITLPSPLSGASANFAKIGYSFYGWSDSYVDYNEFMSNVFTKVTFDSLEKFNNKESYIYDTANGSFVVASASDFVSGRNFYTLKTDKTADSIIIKTGSETTGNTYKSSESKTLYAIWVPYEMIITFYSGTSSTSPSIDTGENNTATTTLALHYGDIATLPDMSNSVVAKWTKTNQKLDKWRITKDTITKTFGLGEQVSVEDLLEYSSLDTIYTLGIYSQWINENVTVKIKLGDMSTSSFLGIGEERY